MAAGVTEAMQTRVLPNYHLPMLVRDLEGPKVFTAFCPTCKWGAVTASQYCPYGHGKMVPVERYLSLCEVDGV
jgi:hypothetical protein